MLSYLRRVARDNLPRPITLRLQKSRVWQIIKRQLPYEPAVARAIRSIVQPGWTAVDVGGHMGRFSHLLAEIVGPDGQVIVFEAHPENARAIARLMERHGLASRVRVENLAIAGGEESQVWLYGGRNRSDAEWNIVGHDVEGHNTGPEMRVPATSLDNYFPPAARVDFVKIDIEGAEDLALRGMRRILIEERPTMVIEFHNETARANGTTVLLNAGYSLETIVEPISADGNRIDHSIARHPNGPRDASAMR